MGGDAIGEGLRAAERLSSREAWRQAFEDEGAAAWQEAIDAIEALLAALTPGTAYRRRLRERVASLLHFAREQPRPQAELPAAVVDLARACLLPVPLAGTATRADEGATPGTSAYDPPRVRAMAAGGGGLDWDDGPSLGEACQQTTDALAAHESVLVVFIVDKDGVCLAASGTTESLDTSQLAALTADGLERASQRLVREGSVTLGRVRVELLAGRLLLIAICRAEADPGDAEGAAKAAAGPLRAVLRGSSLAPIEAHDLDRLFGG